MTFPCDMVDVEMVHMDMVDMDMVDVDMVDVDMVDIYQGSWSWSYYRSSSNPFFQISERAFG